MIDDLWYRNAVIYCLDLSSFADGNGDGMGDFAGLTRRLDYLAGLGVTCVWLLPFYPSPNQDNGYDVADYYGVDASHGTLGELVEFMNHARQLGLRVLVDLVVNHTSAQHPWFQEARAGRDAPRRDWYLWRDERPEDAGKGVVFPPEQDTTWTFDEQAGAYYFHRFYCFQPDLNTANPQVRDEIMRIMGFWLALGVSGFRLDAVPFLIQRAHGSTGPEEQEDFTLLEEMREFLQWRRGDAVLLAEANVPAEASGKYFGPRGDRLHMMLNFPVNQALFYALATADLAPLVESVRATAKPPLHAQWVNFLRSHDELDLGRLEPQQREAVFAAFGPEPDMQLFHRGIRRRLAPMLDNDARRLRLAHSLLLSLPGTPMLGYGDEIGMGDDLSLPGREAARTPMQWSDAKHGGFSTADRLYRPVIETGPFGYRQVNVRAQQRDEDSLLSWIARTLRARKGCPEISWGDWQVLDGMAPGVLVMRCDWRGSTLVTVHNFAGERRRLALSVAQAGSPVLEDLLARNDSVAADQTHRLELEPYDFRWFRSGPEEQPRRA